jgi:hypothetical protein
VVRSLKPTGTTKTEPFVDAVHSTAGSYIIDTKTGAGGHYRRSGSVGLRCRRDGKEISTAPHSTNLIYFLKPVPVSTTAVLGWFEKLT